MEKIDIALNNLQREIDEKKLRIDFGIDSIKKIKNSLLYKIAARFVCPLAFLTMVVSVVFLGAQLTAITIFAPVLACSVLPLQLSVMNMISVKLHSKYSILKINAEFNKVADSFCQYLSNAALDLKTCELSSRLNLTEVYEECGFNMTTIKQSLKRVESIMDIMTYHKYAVDKNDLKYFRDYIQGNFSYFGRLYRLNKAIKDGKDKDILLMKLEYKNLCEFERAKEKYASKTSINGGTKQNANRYKSIFENDNEEEKER